MLGMGIIKIELNVSELDQALRGFKENRLKTLEQIDPRVQRECCLLHLGRIFY